MVCFSYLSLVCTVFTYLHSFKHTYLHNSSFFLLYSGLLSICTPSGGRTRTVITDQQILSLSCLPIPTSEQYQELLKVTLPVSAPKTSFLSTIWLFIHIIVVSSNSLTSLEVLKRSCMSRSMTYSLFISLFSLEQH